MESTRFEMQAHWRRAFLKAAHGDQGLLESRLKAELWGFDYPHKCASGPGWFFAADPVVEPRRTSKLTGVFESPFGPPGTVLATAEDVYVGLCDPRTFGSNFLIRGPNAEGSKGLGQVAWTLDAPFPTDVDLISYGKVEAKKAPRWASPLTLRVDTEALEPNVPGEYGLVYFWRSNVTILERRGV